MDLLRESERMTPQERLSAAYAHCRTISRKHYENFPTASYLVGRDKRDALAAIYSFARAADDVADEPGQGTPEQRLAALARWRDRLNECYDKPSEELAHPVFIALGDAARRYHLSRENLDNLLRAFEQDVVTSRHQDFESLLSYCTCSANPVGRLVLELFGYRDPALFLLSDHICTALQLANFWQDAAVDLSRDRIYLPSQELARFGLTAGDLEGFLNSGRAVSDVRWRGLMAFQVSRTAGIFEQGRMLPERVRRDLRRQLRLTWLAGMRILDRIEAVNYDVFSRRPKLSVLDFASLYLKSWRAPDAAGRAARVREAVS